MGDSITFLWDLEYFFPSYSIKKHAVSGATVQDIDYWKTFDCEGLPTVLLIGTNNIGFFKSTDDGINWIQSEFTKEYIKRAIALKASPLIAVSILPRDFNNRQDSTTNIMLKRQNEALAKALDSSGIQHKFLDVFDYYIKEDFKIRKDLFKDGLHPNEEGYEILADKIQEAL